MLSSILSSKGTRAARARKGIPHISAKQSKAERERERELQCCDRSRGPRLTDVAILTVVSQLAEHEISCKIFERKSQPSTGHSDRLLSVFQVLQAECSHKPQAAKYSVFVPPIPTLTAWCATQMPSCKWVGEEVNPC